MAAKKATNTLAAISAMRFHGSGSMTAPSAASSTWAWLKASTSTPSDTVMPAEPMASGMRRPTLSTITMPTTVNRTLTEVEMIWISRDCSSGMPTDCQRVSE